LKTLIDDGRKFVETEIIDSVRTRSHSFVVKMWEEIASGSRRPWPMWRGSVEHVQGRAKGFFETLDELSDFLLRQTGASMSRGNPIRIFLRWFFERSRRERL
jgi:hypothetical protein